MSKINKLKDVDWFRVIVILACGGLAIWVSIMIGNAFGGLGL